MLGDPLFGEILIAGYLLFLTLIWFIMVLAVSKWGRAWEVDCPEHAPENTCSVSVCIPARNEALNIGECVQSVLNKICIHAKGRVLYSIDSPMSLKM